MFWTPSARPDHRDAGPLGHRGEGQAVVGHRHRAGEDHQGHRDPGAQTGREAQSHHGGHGRHGHPPQRPHAAADHVGELTGGDPATGAEHLGQGDHHPCGLGGPVPVAHQPGQRKGPHHELRHHEQHRDAVDADEVAVGAVGAGIGRRRAFTTLARRVDDDTGDQGQCDRRGDGRDGERGDQPVTVGERGHGQSRQPDAERLSHLPDAHGQPAAVGGEPAHDDPTARAVGCRCGGACHEQGRTECPRSVDGHGRRPGDGRQTEAGEQRAAFAVPVGEGSPGDEGEHDSDHRRGGDEPGLREAESLPRVQDRDEEGRPVHGDGCRRLRGGAGGQHGPAACWTHGSRSRWGGHLDSQTRGERRWPGRLTGS